MIWGTENCVWEESETPEFGLTSAYSKCIHHQGFLSLSKMGLKITLLLCGSVLWLHKIIYVKVNLDDRFWVCATLIDYDEVVSVFLFSTIQ